MDLAPTLGQLSILLLEPSLVQQKIIAQALTTAGIQHVRQAQTIREAVGQIAEDKPDLIISAMYLSDGDANSFVQLLKGHTETEDIHFMLVSSERNREHLETVRQSGVLAILPKPFELEALNCAIKASLDMTIETEIELTLFDPKLLQVLVVDDSSLAQKHIARTLNNMGITHISYAENGKQGYQCLLDGNFDLIITDYNMPEMDGKELTEQVRNTGSLAHIPILMVSSDASEPQLANVAQQGVDAICNKQFTPDTIRRLLHQILD